MTEADRSLAISLGNAIHALQEMAYPLIGDANIAEFDQRVAKVIDSLAIMLGGPGVSSLSLVSDMGRGSRAALALYGRVRALNQENP